MPHILLTGFGPFQSVVSNPSERVVRYFAAQTVHGATLTTRCFPVSFRTATAEMAEAIASGGPHGEPFDAILMLGVAGERPHWSVERVGRNCSTTAAADGENFRWPQAQIVPEALPELPSTLPGLALVAAIENAGLPVLLSESAGDYLCNHLLFWTLEHLRSQGLPTRAGFLHIPADPDTFAPSAGNGFNAPRPTFPFQQHCAAVQAVLETLTAPVGDSLDI